jgi:hypothetical protein
MPREARLTLRERDVGTRARYAMREEAEELEEVQALLRRLPAD